MILSVPRPAPIALGCDFERALLANALTYYRAALLAKEEREPERSETGECLRYALQRIEAIQRANGLPTRLL